MHKVITDTAEGLMMVIYGVVYASFSLSQAGNIIGIISGVLAGVASTFAILFYRAQLRNLDNKNSHHKNSN